MDCFEYLRHDMVRSQIKKRGVKNPDVLQAMTEVPRHLFCLDIHKNEAYKDSPLPFLKKQTISQPFIVADMTAKLIESLNGKKPNLNKVLEIGTGSGYQTAILAQIFKKVFSLEIHAEMTERASKKLSAMNYDHITLKTSDGFAGLPEEAPFDAIMVTCAPSEIPVNLLEQLSEDSGRMLIPAGNFPNQHLYLFEKNGEEIKWQKLYPVLFVKMLPK